MGVASHLPPGVRTSQMVALGIVLLALFLARHRGWVQVSHVAAVGVGLALVSPYALAGPFGWRAYAVVTGLLIAILGLLGLTFLIHRMAFGWQTQARWIAGLRLGFDSVAIAALVMIVFWPRFAPH